MYQKYKSAELVKPSGLELKDRLVGVQRVTKVTKGGRAFGFSAIVVVGDEAGVVGHGLGKSKDVASAIAKAVEDAKKNLVRIPILKGTLPHEQKGKYGGARVNLIPAAPGTGVIAGGAVRIVLEAVGVHDVLSNLRAHQILIMLLKLHLMLFYSFEMHIKLHVIVEFHLKRFLTVNDN